MKALLLAMVMLVPGAAWAGCWDPSEHPDRPALALVTLCYAGQCEQTALDFTCSNANGGQTGYTNGWLIRLDQQNDATVTFKGTPRDPAKLSCKDSRNSEGIGADETCWFIM